MKKLLFTAAMLCALPCLALGQAYTAVSATNVLVDSGGAAVHPPAGTNLCFLGTNTLGAAVTYTPQGGSPTSGKVCRTLDANGALTAPLQVANAATATPAPLVYTVTVENGSTVYMTISRVSVQGALFSLDAFAVPATGTVSGIGVPHIACQQNAAYTSTTIAPGGFYCSLVSGVGSWITYPAAAYCPVGQAYVVPQGTGVPFCLSPALSGLGAPAGSCVERATYFQNDALTGAFLWGCVNGAWQNAGGAGGSAAAGGDLSGNYPNPIVTGSHPYTSMNNFGDSITAGNGPSTAVLTGGKLTTAQQNIANFNGISNGSFTFTVDGIARTVTGVNLTSAASLGDVAAAINAALGSYANVQWLSVNTLPNQFVFTATPTCTGNVNVTASGGVITGVSIVNGFTSCEVGNSFTPEEKDVYGASIGTGAKIQVTAVSGTTATGLTIVSGGSGFVSATNVKGDPTKNSTITYLSSAGVGADLSALLRGTSGTGAAIRAGDATFSPYVSLLGKAMGLPPNNLAVAGATSFDQQGAINSAVPNFSRQLFTYMIGTNNAYAGFGKLPGQGAGSYLPLFMKNMIDELAFLATPNAAKVFGVNACAGQPGWSTSTLEPWNWEVVSTTNGATCTFQTTGNILLLSHSFAQSSRTGAASITVDGSPYGSYTSSGAYDNVNAWIPVGANNYGSVAEIISLPTTGSHTVTITVTSPSGAGNEVYFDWAAGNEQSTFQDGLPTVLAGGTIRHGYGFDTPDNITSIFDQQIRAAVTLLREAGFANIRYVDTRATQDNANINTYIKTDLTHPDQLGHQSLAAAYLDTSNQLRDPQIRGKAQTALLSNGNTAGVGCIPDPANATLRICEQVVQGTNTGNEPTGVELISPFDTYDAAYMRNIAGLGNPALEIGIHRFGARIRALAQDYFGTAIYLAPDATIWSVGDCGTSFGPNNCIHGNVNADGEWTFPVDIDFSQIGNGITGALNHGLTQTSNAMATTGVPTFPSGATIPGEWNCIVTITNATGQCALTAGYNTASKGAIVTQGFGGKPMQVMRGTSVVASVDDDGNLTAARSVTATGGASAFAASTTIGSKDVCLADGTNCPSGFGGQTFYWHTAGPLFTTSAYLGPVVYAPFTAEYNATYSVSSGTCSTAPTLDLRDLGTSASTAFGSSISTYTVALSLASTGNTTGAPINLSANHFYAVSFSAGSCTTGPYVDFTLF